MWGFSTWLAHINAFPDSKSSSEKYPFLGFSHVRGYSKITWHFKGGGQQNVTQPFLLFGMLFLYFWYKTFCHTGKDKASKDTFFLIYLIFQSNFGLNIGDWILINVTLRGGSEKRQNSVTFYLNGPLLQATLDIPWVEFRKYRNCG